MPVYVSLEMTKYYDIQQIVNFQKCIYYDESIKQE